MANSNGWGDGSVNNDIGWGQGANNNIGWGKSHLNSWSGATDIDGGNPPVNSVAPALSGTAQEGQTLTCSTGTWSSSPTYTYQWKRNGNDITSATNSTYTLVTADVGTSIKCTVTATNFTGSATADSNTVTPTSSVDADAQAFITAASITDPTQQSAINNLVIGLKADSLWTKMKAIYPMVGGTSTTNSYNLKNTAQYQITWVGGVTHANTGVTFNGTNGYGNTNFAPNSALTANSNHVALYSRTAAARTNGVAIDFGQGTDLNISNGIWGCMRRSSNNAVYGATNASAQGSVTAANTNGSGMFVNSITSATSRKIYRNAVTLGTLTTNISQTLSAPNMFIGADNNNGSPNLYSDYQASFFSIGDGLDDTETANLNTRVTTFQTALNRNV